MHAIAPDGKPLITCETAADLHAWLAANHTQRHGIWLARYRAHIGKPALGYDDMVEELLCWGWIDSKSGTLDDERSLIWIAPRRTGSGWSSSNKQRIEHLERSGRMQRTGADVVAAAKTSGDWTRLDQSERGEIPDDLAEALSAIPAADQHFRAFPMGVRKAILQWIASAKRPATRTARIHEVAALAADNIRANQWPRTLPTDQQLARIHAALKANE